MVDATLDVLSVKLINSIWQLINSIWQLINSIWQLINLLWHTTIVNGM